MYIYIWINGPLYVQSGICIRNDDAMGRAGVVWESTLWQSPRVFATYAIYIYMYTVPAICKDNAASVAVAA